MRWALYYYYLWWQFNMALNIWGHGLWTLKSLDSNPIIIPY